MQKFAEQRKPGPTFRGVCYENNERPEIVLELPNGGLDIQRTPVYWDLPDGRSLCASMLDLRDMHPDELHDMGSDEAYIALASTFHFDVSQGKL